MGIAMNTTMVRVVIPAAMLVSFPEKNCCEGICKEGKQNKKAPQTRAAGGPGVKL